MKLNDFKLERYFAKYEFAVEYLLSASDCESLTIPELLEYADPAGQAMWQDLKLGYTESQGHPALREEIARLYQTIAPENILVATPEEGIFLAMQALLEPGDGVIALEPAYQSLVEIPRALGCHVSRWTLENREGKWLLDPDKLARMIEPRTKLLIVNFPHNPSGFLPSRDLFAQVVALARKHNLYLFCDEMYWLAEHDPADRLSAAADVHEKGISLFGMSKTFGLPGLRIGWLATQDRASMKKLRSLKDFTTICSSAPSEILALLGLRAKERLIARSMEIIRHNLGLAGEFFGRYPAAFQWLPPQAGSTAFPKLLAETPVEQFCEAVVLQKNLMILPGTVFDFGGNYFRVGLGRRDFGAALERLGDYLADHPL